MHRSTCKTIEEEEIWRIIGDFAQAARRAKEGGLDGVELSAVHQHLIDQFWSPRVNKREDEWGGSFENRMRFGMEVLKAVRAEVGDDFVVGMRICGDEFHPDGLSHEDMKQIATYYDATKMVDFFGVIGSGCDTHNSLANVIPNMSYPPEPFLHLAAGIKEVVTVPVIHAQNIRIPTRPSVSSIEANNEMYYIPWKNLALSDGKMKSFINYFNGKASHLKVAWVDDFVFTQEPNVEAIESFNEGLISEGSQPIKHFCPFSIHGIDRQMLKDIKEALN